MGTRDGRLGQRFPQEGVRVSVWLCYIFSHVFDILAEILETASVSCFYPEVILENVRHVAKVTRKHAGKTPLHHFIGNGFSFVLGTDSISVVSRCGSCFVFFFLRRID